MVPPLLIVGAAVGRTQVELLGCPHVVLHPEGDADEAARGLRRSRRRSAGDLGLDDAVAKLEPLDDDEGLAGHALSLRQLRR